MLPLGHRRYRALAYVLDLDDMSVIYSEGWHHHMKNLINTEGPSGKPPSDQQVAATG